MGKRRGEEGGGTKYPRTQRLKRRIIGNYLGQSCQNVLQNNQKRSALLIAYTFRNYREDVALSTIPTGHKLVSHPNTPRS